MRLLRLLVSLAGTALLAGGYFASQAAFFRGDTAGYVARLDASPVPWLALVLLTAAVVLACVPDREGQEEAGA